MTQIPRLTATASAAHDQAARKDARYFERHPTARAYTRPATKNERQALSLPPGTLVYVRKLGPGVRARAFVTPDEGQN